MDKATPTTASVESVLSIADELARHSFNAHGLEMKKTRAALRAEVERLAAQAASAPAVRMLTEDEVAQATEDGERSFRRWTQGVRGQTLMPQDSPTFHYVMAGAAKALAAFRAAIIADLAADVEPVAFMFQHSETGRITFVDAWQKENGWAAANPRYSEVGALHGASTVAALKAERDAALARVAELEKDAARYRLLRRGQKWSVVDGIGTVLRADELDAAIDAALTKGQLAPQPQQEQSK